MKFIISKGKKIQDDWQVLAADNEWFDSEYKVMKLAQFNQNFLLQKKAIPNFRFGLMIESIVDFDESRNKKNNFFDKIPKNLALIICQFDIFRNGVFYSIARILREQLGYRKELRASGDIYFDHLEFLIRSGFNAFDFAEFKEKGKLEKVLEFINSTNNEYYLNEFTQGVLPITPINQ